MKLNPITKRNLLLNIFYSKKTSLTEIRKYFIKIDIRLVF